MCGPAALVPLAIASAVVTAGGQIYSGIAQSKQAKYESQLAERNAGLAREQARTSEETTRTEAQRRYRDLAQLQGRQQAAGAANGLDTSFGSAAGVARDTTMISAEDVGSIYQTGAARTKGYDISASNYLGEASAKRRAASNALVSTGFNVAGTALSAASQVGKIRAGQTS